MNLIFLKWLFKFLTFYQLSVSRFLKLFYCVTLWFVSILSGPSILLLVFFSRALRRILSAIFFALYKVLFIIIIILYPQVYYLFIVSSCLSHPCKASNNTQCFMSETKQPITWCTCCSIEMLNSGSIIWFNVLLKIACPYQLGRLIVWKQLTLLGLMKIMSHCDQLNNQCIVPCRLIWNKWSIVLLEVNNMFHVAQSSNL